MLSAKFMPRILTTEHIAQYIHCTFIYQQVFMLFQPFCWVSLWDKNCVLVMTWRLNYTHGRKVLLQTEEGKSCQCSCSGVSLRPTATIPIYTALFWDIWEKTSEKIWLEVLSRNVLSLNTTLSSADSLLFQNCE